MNIVLVHDPKICPRKTKRKGEKKKKKRRCDTNKNDDMGQMYISTEEVCNINDATYIWIIILKER